MNTIKNLVLLGVLFVCWTVPSSSKAQYAFKEPASAAYLPAPTYRLERTARTPTTNRSEPKTDHFRHHRRLSATYSGQFIQLILTDRPLARDFELFRQFGKVYYDQLEDGRYAYGLKVDFSSKKAISSFIEGVVRPRAAEARLVEYKKGSRSEK